MFGSLVALFFMEENNQMKKIAKKIKKVYEAKRDICALSDLFALNIDDKNAEINSYVRSESAKLVRDGISADKAFELNKKTYLLTARDNFDDFMTYIEWNREPNARYWQPRRKQLLPVCNALQRLEDDELDELFISMPPRVGKTTLVVFFLLWIMLRGPERSNLYCSYSDTVVGVFYTALTEILNDPMTYLWLDVFPERKLVSTDAKNNLLNIDRKKHYASFTGRSLYGTLNGACDCNGYEIADDLHSGIEEAMSKDRLNAAWMKVDNNYLPRGKEKTKHLWIGTRWSQVDAIARRIDLLENDGKYKSVRYEVINLPALNENDESNFRYLYELGFSTEHYQQRRASFERNNDMASWFAQFMGEPIERDGTVFNPDELRYYNGVLPEGDPDRIFMAVDPAWGGGDFVAAPVCVQYGNDLYVTDVVYDNGDKRVTQPLIVATAKKHNVQALTIEATRTTQDYVQGINEALRADGYRLNVQSSTKHYTGTGKQQRIFDKAPDIRECMLFLENGKRSKAYSLFMQNVFAFKVIGKNKNDDAPDSLAMAITMAFMQSNKAEIMKRLF